MCLYPKLIKNKKYLPTKKNKYNPPVCTDERLRYVTSACGRCYECRSQKRKEWLVRLSEDIRENNNVVFVTLKYIVTGQQDIKTIEKLRK